MSAAGATVVRLVAATCLIWLCQQVVSQAVPVSSTFTAVEFPVIMQQNIVAGQTPVGAKVQAKLSVATLIKGKVIPENAVLSGEVIESAARSASDPSRLAIRIDLAQWKSGSTPLKVYLTAWYYPLETPATQTSADDPTGIHGSVQWGGSVGRPDTRTQPSSLPTTDDRNTLPPRPHSNISTHRVQMKDVESTRGKEDGVVTLISKRSKIKLDRSTTYVFAADELGAGPK